MRVLRQIGDDDGRPDASADEAGDERAAAGRFIPEHEVTSLSAYLLQQACRLTKQQADAEDLAQETLLKAFVSFGSFRDGSNLRAWLYRIMVNAWVDNYRMSQRRPTEQLTGEISSFQPTDRFRSRSDSAEAEVLAALPNETDRALRDLPVELRMTIFYADLQGHPNTEVAKILNIPVGTVGSRLHRGRGLLREMLSDSYPDQQHRFSA